MLELKEVTKIYEIGNTQVPSLNGISLKVEKGASLAVMGPSGSGKSTLLYTIGGLLTPTKGDVTIGGTPIYQLKPRERAKFRCENMGFIFQTFELLPYLTALENVMLPLHLAGMPSAEQTEVAEQALSKVGLEKRANHKPTELSGGEQQRVAIARGIVNNPNIVLADEPTGNLDQKTGTEIMQLLCDLHEKDDLTLIFVTHDPTKSKLAGRVVEMLDGHTVTKRP
ncbi:MAG TPA: ABC transporter ATP-binding protein [Candidatus Bathyarchaeia archaeon]